VFVGDPVLTKHEDDFYENMTKAVSAGEIKYTEHVYRGLESAGQAILDVQTGKNEGKAVIIVAEE
jgi:NADPH-dependent curcumin reductase CurA